MSTIHTRKNKAPSIFHCCPCILRTHIYLSGRVYCRFIFSRFLPKVTILCVYVAYKRSGLIKLFLSIDFSSILPLYFRTFFILCLDIKMNLPIFNDSQFFPIPILIEAPNQSDTFADHAFYHYIPRNNIFFYYYILIQ